MTDNSTSRAPGEEGDETYQPNYLPKCCLVVRIQGNTDSRAIFVTQTMTKYSLF